MEILPYSCNNGHDRISFYAEACPLCREIRNAAKMRQEYEAKIEALEYSFAEQQELEDM